MLHFQCLKGKQFAYLENLNKNVLKMFQFIIFQYKICPKQWENWPSNQSFLIRIVKRGKFFINTIF